MNSTKGTIRKNTFFDTPAKREVIILQFTGAVARVCYLKKFQETSIYAHTAVKNACAPESVT